MNRKILQKVIDAIEESKLDYAMGILDTLMDGLPLEVTPMVSTKAYIADKPVDEGTILDREAANKLEHIKKLAGNGME